MADLIVRVTTPNYGNWLNAFVSAENALLEAGINQWTVYQDTWNPNIVMVHFIAEDIDRAMAFFKSDQFKEINARSGASERKFWVGQEPGASAAKKPAAKRATRSTKSAADSTEKPAKKPATRKPKA